ncbi:SDR family oxidoreductase [Anabaena subtropica]|uniref:SDR family oxidoreductase n=1 Tax=Anabaena subtropica FACHB-260 TaxID=2692884 RepID=A0ABR8CPT9_9NOST|nr:SDR family oxidoreductase [Anabaena subtropica]MBD2344578.1 SDR family oxidoreductase [Anabaena subtropica FACHB-260]
MNITIIGCGYVGNAIAQYWRQNPNLVITATTTTPERVTELQKIAHKVVVTQGNELDKLVSTLQNQDVVLLSVGAKGADLYETAYLNTAKTVVAALQQNSSVKQLIYTGTYSVYGDRNGEWVDEETPAIPTSRNAEILKETEDILLAASDEQLRVCILRLGGIYGPGRELIKIFSRVPGTTRPGDGSDITNWIHLDDIVAAIEFVYQNQLQGIYNLVDDGYLTIKKLLDSLMDYHNLPKVIWDDTLKSNRLCNAKVANQKIKEAGYKIIHQRIIFEQSYK